MTLTRREVIVGAAVAALATTLPAVAAVKPARKAFLMPSFPFAERYETFIEENTITNIYDVMDRWETQPDGKLKIMRAKVDSDLYREWLKEIPSDDGIPPHIQFGGGVTSTPGGDPTFHPRWVERTKAHLASGRLK